LPYKLVVRVKGRALQFPLRDGTFEVGSSADCDIRIPQPTVSRRHARLMVSAEGVLITDLGSSNGTRVVGRRIDGEAPLRPDDVLHIGTVEARIEEVDAGDLEPAVTLSARPASREEEPVSSAAAASTIGPAALEAFSLARLPNLVDLVARGEPLIEVAQAAAAALLDCLPCHRVTVTSGSPDTGAILYSAARGDGEGVPIIEDAADGRSLEVRFTNAKLARAYEPLVVAAAGLIRAASRPVATAGPPRCDRSAPEPPRPPSVVPEVRSVYSQAALIARSRVSVLIRGESGTGKELLARYLHAASDVSEEPLVTLNCAALPRDLLEAELFGVERGVATGVEARAGKFERAHGGTLFLDEIGDMALETQARILRVLQEAEVYRVGGHRPRTAKVRVISATNRDINGMLDGGAFRRDLYHRIADWVVELPPLRRRRSDIPNLAAHFLSRACAERGIRPAGISRNAVEALQAYSWPGNVRQLEKEIGRAALFLESGGLLDTGRLQPEITAARDQRPAGNLKNMLNQTEREHIELALDECGGSAADAAAQLGLPLSTFYRRVRALGIGADTPD
jgi:DNA-binding NtrC family response regulator